MRWQWFVAFGVIATATAVDAVLESRITGRRDSTTQRVLRTRNSVNAGDFGGITVATDKVEERGASIPVKKVTKSLKSTDNLDNGVNKGESADDVFKLLALDRTADNILANPNLNFWIQYMKLFNKLNPTKKTSVIETLTTHYGDEGLAKIIEAAKLTPTTAGLAKRMQTEQIHRWLVAGNAPEDVFTLLKLDKAGTGLFEQPQVVTWAKYLDNFKKENPTSQTTLFSFLKARYKDEATLVQMLIAAEKIPHTKSIAVRVQAEQTSRWLRKRKTPAEVFELLKLDDAGYSLLTNTLFNAWVKYTDDFRKIHFGTTFTTISALRKYYSDHALSIMILAASRSPSTSNIAIRLHTEQLR